MIKFVYAEPEAPAVMFRDVEIDQFFVSKCGSLCQKHSETSYNIFADGDGKPFGGRVDDVPYIRTIKKIIPEVLKIDF